MLGGTFSLLWAAHDEHRTHHAAGAWTLRIAAAAVAVAATGPLVWTVAAYAHRQMQMPVVWREYSILFRRFSHWQYGTYPGLVIDEPAADWTGYRTLLVELRGLGREPSHLTVRIHDRQHDNRHEDRFNENENLAPGESLQLSISLDRVRAAPSRRAMNMKEIRGIIIFQSEAGQSPTFEVREIRLEH
jgi:hypothetical protein